VDTDTLRHLGDRSARIEDEANRLVLVLLGEVSACRHARPPLQSAAVYDRVSTRSGTVHLAPDNQAYNTLLRSTRCLGERGFALLTGRWRALQRVTISPLRCPVVLGP
jgi:hypothetical protein